MKDFNKGVTTQPQIGYDKPINGSYTYTFSGDVVITEPNIPETENNSSSAGYVINNNGKEYVDLGLPSGNLWATTVVSDGPFYFGNTETGEDKYASEDGWTKYTLEDNIGELYLEDDAAHVNWGGDWHTPSVEDFNELYENCTISIYQRYFTKFTSKINGNSIVIIPQYVMSRSIDLDENTVNCLSYDYLYGWIVPKTLPRTQAFSVFPVLYLPDVSK